jgi:hypothetical protein
MITQASARFSPRCSSHAASSLVEDEPAGPQDQQQHHPGNNPHKGQQQLVRRPRRHTPEPVGQHPLQRHADQPHEQQRAQYEEDLDAQLEQQRPILQQRGQIVGGLSHPIRQTLGQHGNVRN